MKSFQLINPTGYKMSNRWMTVNNELGANGTNMAYFEILSHPLLQGNKEMHEKLS
jgi:hypothetical protein